MSWHAHNEGDVVNGDIFDYCVDDPVNFIDPTGLWTAETFEEYKILRDAQGRFSGGSASGVTSSKKESSGLMFYKPYDAPGKREFVQGLAKVLKPKLENAGRGFLELENRWNFIGDWIVRGLKGARVWSVKSRAKRHK